MDRGIATADNILWMNMNGYKYIVASREQLRNFDSTLAVKHRTRSGNIISFHKEEVDTLINNTSNKEIRLNCHSSLRQAKEEGIDARRIKKYKSGLNKLVNKIKNFRKPVFENEVNKVIARLGVLHHVSQHFKISIVKSCNKQIDFDNPCVTDLFYEFKPIPNSRITHPGVYNIRTNILNLSEQEIWETYMTQTKVESFFRSLESDLGLRPNFHLKDDRIDGHFYISVLAYQCVNWIRNRLSFFNINHGFSWEK
jgi:hypothetical protein